MVTLIGNGAHARDIIATGVRLTGLVTHHSAYVDDGNPVVIGINDPQLRAKVARDIGVTDRAWVHPRAWASQSSWGYGTHVNYGVTMTRTRLGRWVTVSPGVTICGDVTVGDRVLIGAGATVCDRVLIGDGAVIGAGAVVLPETVIGDGETWVGVPARPT